MYKVMLVEDDETIRYVYSKMKSWGRYGFCLEAEAANGVRALEKLKEKPVDVIFTDIRMPLMDGISLMKESASLYPDIMFVFISSYNEFEYAREGLRLGAVDYIVKPMKETDLEEVLQRIKGQLDAGRSRGMTELFERMFPETELLADPLISRVIQYIEENMDKNLTMEEVADALGMNKDYFGRQMKGKTQISFHNMYTQIKMEYAKPMVKSGQYRIYEISEMLGYASPDYFSHLFKSIVKMTPAEYKKSGQV